MGVEEKRLPNIFPKKVREARRFVICSGSTKRIESIFDGHKFPDDQVFDVIIPDTISPESDSEDAGDVAFQKADVVRRHENVATTDESREEGSVYYASDVVVKISHPIFENSQQFHKLARLLGRDEENREILIGLGKSFATLLYCNGVFYVTFIIGFAMLDNTGNVNRVCSIQIDGEFEEKDGKLREQITKDFSDESALQRNTMIDLASLAPIFAKKLTIRNAHTSDLHSYDISQLPDLVKEMVIGGVLPQALLNQLVESTDIIEQDKNHPEYELVRLNLEMYDTIVPQEE